jgi:predicted murein hydrolase (TIGR00659 family)
MNLFYLITSISVTLLLYLASKKLYRAYPWALLNPVLVTPILLMVLLVVTHTSIDQYNEGGRWLSQLLQPATVAFAIPMYKHFDKLRKHAVQLLSSVTVGSTMAIFTSVGLACLLHVSPVLVASLAPRSVTTPIAMEISKTVGGSPSLTAVFVILTGISGIIFGPLIIRMFSLRSQVAKGILLGMGAHGSGTSRAFEYGQLEGTFAILAMVFAALASDVMAPWLVPFLQTTLA